MYPVFAGLAVFFAGYARRNHRPTTSVLGVLSALGLTGFFLL
jgi:hypothetical protein